MFFIHCVLRIFTKMRQEIPSEMLWFQNLPQRIRRYNQDFHQGAQHRLSSPRYLLDLEAWPVAVLPCCNVAKSCTLIISSMFLPLHAWTANLRGCTDNLLTAKHAQKIIMDLSLYRSLPSTSPGCTVPLESSDIDKRINLVELQLCFSLSALKNCSILLAIVPWLSNFRFPSFDWW